MRPRRLLTAAVTGAAVALVTAGGAGAADWPAYLNGPSRPHHAGVLVLHRQGNRSQSWAGEGQWPGYG